MRSIGALLAMVVALTPRASDDDLAPRVDRAIAEGTRALIAAQSPDGAWRSKTYGAFKDGLSLTPSVLKAIAFAPTVEGSDAARVRGASFLARQVRPDGSIDERPFGRLYPVYADSASSIALTKIFVPGGPEAIAAFVADLRRRQLDDSLGWSPDDPPFGAWGYALEPARKRLGGRAIDADLSSTLFAVGALRLTGAPAEDPAIRKALVFVRRCQNFESADPGFDDGGFFLSPTDPARNKAGITREGRFPSYGSATADGLRALLRCGLPVDHPRVVAALRWLERNFSPSTVPGRFEPTAEDERDATFYYYCWSLSHAFRSMGVRTFDLDGRKVDWAAEMAAELLRRQRRDGTWSDRYSASKEDDPLVATPFALGALANGRPASP
jgi:squalene-hopene/tetraprenyl-beta-curcumene cyclase